MGFAKGYSSFYMTFAIITYQLYGFCHNYFPFYMALVRRLLIIKLPHPPLVQPPSPCMRAEIGQQTAETERFGQELRQEFRTERSNQEWAEAIVITFSIVGGVVGSSRDDSLGMLFLSVGGNVQANPVSDLSKDILVVLSP